MSLESLSKAASRRVNEKMNDPYEGIVYEFGKPRNDRWVTLREKDFLELIRWYPEHKEPSHD